MAGRGGTRAGSGFVLILASRAPCPEGVYRPFALLDMFFYDFDDLSLYASLPVSAAARHCAPGRPPRSASAWPGLARSSSAAAWRHCSDEELAEAFGKPHP